MSSIHLEISGRRIYLRGNTYPLRDRIRALGGHWDRDEVAWWVGTGKRAEVEALIADAAAKAEEREAALPPASGEMVAVDGNTYPVRDQLREIGGRWDAASKVWRVPASRLAKAREIVASAPKKERSGFRRSSGRCRECRGPLVSYSYHRAMHGLCGQCAFDEYDC